MQIALHGADDDAAGRLGPRLGQLRGNQGQRKLHRPGGNQQLRHEVFIALDAPHLIHGGDQVFLHQFLGIRVVGQSRLGDFLGLFRISMKNGFVQFRRFRHVSPPRWAMIHD